LLRLSRLAKKGAISFASCTNYFFPLFELSKEISSGTKANRSNNQELLLVHIRITNNAILL